MASGGEVECYAVDAVGVAHDDIGAAVFPFFQEGEEVVYRHGGCRSKTVSATAGRNVVIPDNVAGQVTDGQNMASAHSNGSILGEEGRNVPRIGIIPDGKAVGQGSRERGEIGGPGRTDGIIDVNSGAGGASGIGKTGNGSAVVCNFHGPHAVNGRFFSFYADGRDGVVGFIVTNNAT